MVKSELTIKSANNIQFEKFNVFVNIYTCFPPYSLRNTCFPKLLITRRWGRWPWLFRQPHQVHGHFPHPWNFIYNPQKLLFFSGWSWFQFFIPDSAQGSGCNFVTSEVRLSVHSRHWLTFEKNTHIRGISYSVTHLLSFQSPYPNATNNQCCAWRAIEMGNNSMPNELDHWMTG